MGLIMPYIITSKTRRRTPNGRTVAMDNPKTGETRICDERYAEKRHAGGNRTDFSEPREIGSRPAS